MSLEKIHLYDGSKGVVLGPRAAEMRQQLGSEALGGDFLNLWDPRAVRQLHEDYIQAGSHIIQTNTFQANPHALELTDIGVVRAAMQRIGPNVGTILQQIQDKLGDTLSSDLASGALPTQLEVQQMSAEDVAYLLNLVGGQLALQAAFGHEVMVAGSVGPVDNLDLHKEMTPAEYQDACHLFRPQISGLIDAGVQIIHPETMGDLRQITHIVEQTMKLRPDLPVWTSMSFNEKPGWSGKFGSLLGDRPYQLVAEAVRLGLPVFGANCGEGPVAARYQLVTGLRELHHAGNLLVKFNAGPYGKGAYYGPEEMVEFAQGWVECALRGARGGVVVGFCCGAGPHYVEALANHLA